MNVLLVTFRLTGMDEPAYRRLAQSVAPTIARSPGLLGKTWLADPATHTYGGLVLFDSRQALDAYLASEVMGELRANPRLTEFSATRFDTLAEASRMTRGLLPVATASPPAPRTVRHHQALRQRLAWRTHGTAPSPIAAHIDAEPTWEDAEWR